MLHALALLAALTAARTPPAQSNVRPVVYGYYTAYSGLAPQNIRYRYFTHLSHAFVTGKPDGSAVLEGERLSATLVRLAHAHGVKVLLAVGGSESGPWLGKIAGNAAKRRKFIGAILVLVRRYGYDGVDVDWEFPEHQSDLVVTFVQELRTALKGAGRPLLTMAVPASAYYGQWYDARLRSLVDWLQIMTYDLHGDWPGSHSGHNSPLHPTSTDSVDGRLLSLDNFVSYWLGKGFPRQKLLVGIPCYGYRFSVGRWGVPLPAKTTKEIEYRDIPGFVRSGWKPQRDMEAGVPYLRAPAGNGLVTYDDPASARAKGAWARQHGLRGIFFWEISQDIVNGDNTLVRATITGWAAPLRHH